MNLIGNHDYVVVDVVRPQVFDECGGLLDGYIEVAVRLHEEYGGVPLVDGRDGGGFHRAAVRIVSVDWLAHRGQERGPVVYARVIDTGRECIRGTRQTEFRQESTVAVALDG